MYPCVSLRYSAPLKYFPHILVFKRILLYIAVKDLGAMKRNCYSNLLAPANMKEKKHIDGDTQIFKTAPIQRNCSEKALTHLPF